MDVNTRKQRRDGNRAAWLAQLLRAKEFSRDSMHMLYLLGDADAAIVLDRKIVKYSFNEWTTNFCYDCDQELGVYAAWRACSADAKVWHRHQLYQRALRDELPGFKTEYFTDKETTIVRIRLVYKGKVLETDVSRMDLISFDPKLAIREYVKRGIMTLLGIVDPTLPLGLASLLLCAEEWPAPPLWIPGSAPQWAEYLHILLTSDTDWRQALEMCLGHAHADLKTLETALIRRITNGL